jgi:Ca-activated chloride channel family protein
MTPRLPKAAVATFAGAFAALILAIGSMNGIAATANRQTAAQKEAAQKEAAQKETAGKQKPQVFRAAIDIVSLNVTVIDGQNRYVTDVNEQEFSVFEDGAKQDLIFFNRTSLPIALSLLIDTSASMESRLSIAQEAAIGFARKLRAQDLAQIVDFDSRVEIAQAFTNNVADLEKAIRATTAGGSTSLHNAIYISLRELSKIRAKSEEDIRRRAIVVLSDGEDTSSLVSYEEVMDLAKRSETAIYTIGLQSKDGPQTKGFREAEFTLRQFAQETGGRAFFPMRIEDLKDVYSQIAAELSSQYTMGYASKNPRRDGAWRRIVVQVARPNITARTKRGYFAPVAN